MSSSATNIRSSWLDPFHRSLCLRRKLESTYHQHLCLPPLQRSRDRMSAVHIGQKKESGIDSATRVFNDTNVPPSSMLHPNLLISGNNNIYSDDFGLDDNTTTSLFSGGPGHSSPVVSPSFGDVSTLPDSPAVDLSALESVQASGKAPAVGVAQPMLPLAPESVPLAAPAVVHNAAQTSTQQQLSTTAVLLTPTSTPTPADSLGAGLCAPEPAHNATAGSCKLLRS